jgi:hypothetical protein
VISARQPLASCYEAITRFSAVAMASQCQHHSSAQLGQRKRTAFKAPRVKTDMGLRGEIIVLSFSRVELLADTSVEEPLTPKKTSNNLNWESSEIEQTSQDVTCAVLWLGARAQRCAVSLQG